MTKLELIGKLRTIRILHEDNPEMAHIEADKVILQYIDDDDITHEYDEVEKWYS